CGAASIPDARFCPTCGVAVSESPDEAKSPQDRARGLRRRIKPAEVVFSIGACLLVIAIVIYVDSRRSPGGSAETITLHVDRASAFSPSQFTDRGRDGVRVAVTITRRNGQPDPQANANTYNFRLVAQDGAVYPHAPGWGMRENNCNAQVALPTSGSVS